MHYTNNFSVAYKNELFHVKKDQDYNWENAQEQCPRPKQVHVEIPISLRQGQKLDKNYETRLFRSKSKYTKSNNN